MRRILLLLALCVPHAGAAQVYKCQEGDTVSYRDKPCPSGDGEEMKLDKGPAKTTQEVRLIDAANRGRVMIGMSADQVRIAWGRPTSINRSVGHGSVNEQWVYRRGSGSAQYIYLEDGKVTSWQD